MKADDHIRIITEFHENMELLRALIKDCKSQKVTDRLLEIYKKMQQVEERLSKNLQGIEEILQEMDLKSLMHG